MAKEARSGGRARDFQSGRAGLECLLDVRVRSCAAREAGQEASEVDIRLARVSDVELSSVSGSQPRSLVNATLTEARPKRTTLGIDCQAEVSSRNRRKREGWNVHGGRESATTTSDDKRLTRGQQACYARRGD